MVDAPGNYKFLEVALVDNFFNADMLQTYRLWTSKRQKNKMYQWFASIIFLGRGWFTYNTIDIALLAKICKHKRRPFDEIDNKMIQPKIVFQLKNRIISKSTEYSFSLSHNIYIHIYLPSVPSTASLQWKICQCHLASLQSIAIVDGPLVPPWVFCSLLHIHKQKSICI